MKTKGNLIHESIDFEVEILRKYPNVNKHILNRYLIFISKMIKKNVVKEPKITETHHILPKSDFKEFYSYYHNLVVLPTREHFVAHLILAHLLKGKHWMAVNMMADSENPFQQRKLFSINSRIYERMKMEASKYVSENITKLRTSESKEITISRVEKWKISRAKRTQEEKEISIQKRRESRSRNKDLGLHKLSERMGFKKNERSWFTDGKDNFLLLFSDPLTESLNKGRVNINCGEGTGSKWYNNGEENIRLFDGDARTELLKKGLLKKYKPSIRTKWYNDGITNYRLIPSDESIEALALKEGRILK